MKFFKRQHLIYNFLIWSLVAVFTATQLFFKELQSGSDKANWLDHFKIQLLVWWVWGFITPFIFWLVNRFRIDRGNLLKNIVFHLCASVTIVAVYLAFYSLIWNTVTLGSLKYQMFQTVYIALFLNLFHWHLFIYMAILGVIHAREFYFEVKEKELRSIRLEKDLLESQLRMLKMQLQPHFLFNALNSIVSSIHRKKLDTAVNMTTDLSELLRISLAEADIELVPLSKELHHLKTYLSIEAHRFKDLEIVYDVSEDLLDKLIPNFLLQPIVENSIKHGISQQQDAKKIIISIKKEDSEVIINIFNEGPPLEQEKLEGIGISNIKKRLRSSYESGASFAMKSINNGVMAKLHLPI
ncbi:MAG: histidine kinase [Bacteroidota bacterium]